MLKKIFTYCLFLSIFLVSSQVHEIYAQSDKSQQMLLKNPEGTVFWLCFMKNYRPEKSEEKNELLLELFLTGKEDADVEIEVPKIGFKEKIFVPANTVRSIKIDPSAQIERYDTPEIGAAVKVTSTTPISVYGLNRRFQTTDTYLGLPERVLGTEYRVMCYSVSDGYVSQFAVVATEDTTVVEINPVVNTTLHKAGQPYTVRLNKGDVYQVAAKFEPPKKCDLTGSYIRSNKKIAVFSGHQCAYVPEKVIACNHLAEQLPPLPAWGKHFYIGQLEPRSRYTYRVLANEKDTKVFEDAKLLKVLKDGEFLERTLNNDVQITADKPVLVAQYSQGFKNGDSIGDPMMLLISPTQQFLKQYRFATPINGEWNHYVNIVVPSKSIKNLRLDGRALQDTSVFEAIGISRYSIGYIKVPFGTHVIECSVPFGLYSYGFGYGADSYDAYGTMGGQSFVDYEPSLDTLAPTFEIDNSEYPSRVIIRDDRVDDTGIRDITVLFTDAIEAEIPKVESGSPQVSFTVKPKYKDKMGRIIISAEDITGNRSTYTVCYTFDAKTETHNFSLFEGEDQHCSQDPGFQVGAFLRFGGNFHNADFSSSGEVITKGQFSDAFASSFSGGLLFGRRFKYNLLLSARLSFEKYSGVLISPDSTLSQIRYPDSLLSPFQESYELQLDGLYSGLSLAAEYYFKNYFYVLGGLNISINWSSAIDLQKRILLPDSYVYENGERTIVPADAPSKLSSLHTFNLGAFLGFGVSFPVTYYFSIFTEVTYLYHFSNLIDDGQWSLGQTMLTIGGRVRI